jgi:hypothetical protein
MTRSPYPVKEEALISFQMFGLLLFIAGAPNAQSKHKRQNHYPDKADGLSVF